MENTMLIQPANAKAVELLHQMEEQHLIKVLKENISEEPLSLADKYLGILTKEQGESLDAHIKQMRNEWNDI